jgi:hypothetical protein
MTKDEILKALNHAIKFIEYARYELEPGELQLGDQFPRQGCADKEIASLKEVVKALEGQ